MKFQNLIKTSFKVLQKPNFAFANYKETYF